MCSVRNFCVIDDRYFQCPSSDSRRIALIAWPLLGIILCNNLKAIQTWSFFISWLWFGKVLSIAETDLDASLALYWTQFWGFMHHFVCATRRWHCWFLELCSEPNLLISYAQFWNVRHGRISIRIIGHVAHTILRSCWQKSKPEHDSNAARQVLDAIRECHLPVLCCIQ